MEHHPLPRMAWIEHNSFGEKGESTSRWWRRRRQRASIVTRGVGLRYRYSYSYSTQLVSSVDVAFVTINLLPSNDIFRARTKPLSSHRTNSPEWTSFHLSGDPSIEFGADRLFSGRRSYCSSSRCRHCPPTTSWCWYRHRMRNQPRSLRCFPGAGTDDAQHHFRRSARPQDIPPDRRRPSNIGMHSCLVGISSLQIRGADLSAYSYEAWLRAR